MIRALESSERMKALTSIPSLSLGPKTAILCPSLPRPLLRIDCILLS